MPQPPEILWSPLAAARLQEIRAFIALDNPSAAERIASRILALAEALRLHPHLGHTTSEPHLRELPVGGTPYVICYQIRGRRIVIATLRHSAQQK